MPVSHRIILENLLRNENGATVTAQNIEKLIQHQISSEEAVEVTFYPSRSPCAKLPATHLTMAGAGPALDRGLSVYLHPLTALTMSRQKICTVRPSPI